MSNALNDLMVLESAVLRFKSNYTKDYDPFRGCTIEQPEARRVRLAVQEILSVDVHLHDVLVACAPEPAMGQAQSPTNAEEKMRNVLRREIDEEEVEYTVVHHFAGESPLTVIEAVIILALLGYFIWLCR